MVAADHIENLFFADRYVAEIERAAFGIENISGRDRVEMHRFDGKQRFRTEHIFRREGIFHRLIQQQFDVRLFHRHRHVDGDRVGVLLALIGYGERDQRLAFGNARYHAILRDLGDTGGVALPHCVSGREDYAAPGQFVGKSDRIGALLGGNFRIVRLDFQHGGKIGRCAAPHGDIAVFNVEVFGIEPGCIEVIGQFEVFHRRGRAVQHGYAGVINIRIVFQPDPA